MFNWISFTTACAFVAVCLKGVDAVCTCLINNNNTNNNNNNILDELQFARVHWGYTVKKTVEIVNLEPTIEAAMHLVTSVDSNPRILHRTRMWKWADLLLLLLFFIFFQTKFLCQAICIQWTPKGPK